MYSSWIKKCHKWFSNQTINRLDNLEQVEQKPFMVKVREQDFQDSPVVNQQQQEEEEWHADRDDDQNMPVLMDQDAECGDDSHDKKEEEDGSLPLVLHPGKAAGVKKVKASF